ncbi:hypothetical protein TNCV_579621 [Trichonephila clavipes]|nr:hypothetical protein TNCV_579621 [Trichonephila clavipes]
MFLRRIDGAKSDTRKFQSSAIVTNEGLNSVPSDPSGLQNFSRAAVAQWSRYRIESWQACHEFNPSTIEDPPCGENMHFKSVES